MANVAERSSSVQSGYSACPVDRAWNLGHAEGMAGLKPSIPLWYDWTRTTAYTEGWRAGDAGRVLALADQLAWLADSAGNTIEDYPGPGWDDDMMALHGNDHDAQPDPFALEVWTLPNDEWYDAEAMFAEWEGGAL